MKNLQLITTVLFLFLKETHFIIKSSVTATLNFTNSETTIEKSKLLVVSTTTETTKVNEIVSFVTEENVMKNLTIKNHESINQTILSNCSNETVTNTTCSEDMQTEKKNYTIVAGAIASQENNSEFGVQKTAAIASGVFLVSAILGYAGCVGYRRYLQRRYGDCQRLTSNYVYDTSDLRNF